MNRPCTSCGAPARAIVNDVELMLTPDLAPTGLLAIAHVISWPFRIRVSVRRTAEGRLVVSYPRRRGPHGLHEPDVLPLDRDVRVAIERAAIEAYEARIAARRRP